jgi:hypothetical protein
MSVSMIKNAAITTATVLAVIYVLNMTPAKPLVQRALAG